MILHIITGLNDGGAEAVLYRLCHNSPQHKHVVVSMMDAGKYGPLLEDIGVEVYYLNLSKGRLTFSGIMKMFQIIRKLQPDIVQTWMYHANLIGGIVARLAGTRNVIWSIHHTTLHPNFTKRRTILTSRLCSFVSGFVPRAIICCAEKSREVHLTQGYAGDRMVVIPNGYDLSQFTPDPAARQELARELGLDPSVHQIGLVARYNPQKDHRNLIAALEYLKGRITGKFVCLLVGTDIVPENKELSTAVLEAGLGDHIRLLGCRNDIPKIMSSLDLHVMSSQGGEAFPNVICEAMACGTPCISTDVGDARIIIGDTGWVVAPSAPKQLASAIEAALDEVGTTGWRERQNAARGRIQQNFSVQQMADAYSRVWWCES